MTQPFTIYIPGTPATITAQQKGISFRRRIVFTKTAVKAETARVRQYAQFHFPPKPLLGPIRVHIIVVFPLTLEQATKHADRLSDPTFVIPRIVTPDLDNLSKLYLDAISNTPRQRGIWANDSQVFDEHLVKYNGSEPRIEITVTPAA